MISSDLRAATIRAHESYSTRDNNTMSREPNYIYILYVCNVFNSACSLIWAMLMYMNLCVLFCVFVCFSFLIFSSSLLLLRLHCYYFAKITQLKWSKVIHLFACFSLSFFVPKQLWISLDMKFIRHTRLNKNKTKVTAISKSFVICSSYVFFLILVINYIYGTKIYRSHFYSMILSHCKVRSHSIKLPVIKSYN